MNDASKSRMIEKIKKLLALANSPNEAEAMSASEKAHALLAEYNLEMSDVETADEDAAMKGIIDDGDLTDDSWPWRRPLAGRVAELYFCKYFYVQSHKYDGKMNPRRVDSHHFVGAKHNVVVAKLTFGYLIEAVERLADEGAQSVTRIERDRYKRAFMWAASRRLAMRIDQRIESAKKGGQVKTEGGTNLPALQDLYDQTKKQLTTFIKENVGGLRTVRRGGSSSHHGGSSDGSAAGDRISLDKQVGGRGGAGHLLGHSK